VKLWEVIEQYYSEHSPVSWLVINSISKRSHTCNSAEEANAIAESLNKLEE